MKLPENKKERVQVFVLIGIGAAAVIFASWQGLVSPFFAYKQRLQESLQTKRTALEKAERELRLAPSIKEEFDSVTSQLDTTIANNLLRPILGSYLVGVTETLENQARAINVKVDEIQEIGIRELPRANNAGANPVNFKSYSVQVSARASYEQASKLINNLEELNPYLCVSDIRITGQADTPEYHRLSLRIEWPIEAESEKGQNSMSDRGGGS